MTGSGRLTDTTDPTEAAAKVIFLEMHPMSNPSDWDHWPATGRQRYSEIAGRALAAARRTGAETRAEAAGHLLDEIENLIERRQLSANGIRSRLRLIADRHTALLAQPERICAAEIWGPLQPANLSKICQLPAGHAGEHLHRPALAQPEESTPE